ncbi:hypothetical protein [Rheinheimera aquimaris]|uniref:hypothetical protein n=1 Tax=Rheinheimera aquimaris TaxID=412437 RepID=UPI003A974A58
MSSAGDLKVKGTQLSTKIFGGILDIDNSGSSAGVELLNFVFGVKKEHMLAKDRIPDPQKYGHHIARQLAYGVDSDFEEKVSSILQGNDAQEVLGKLFSSLQIQPPNVKKSTDSGWTRKPFFPFTETLIHWDIKKSNKSIERVWMRGGGSLLHKILREDPNEQRLDKIRDGFSSLYALASRSALHKLAGFFRGIKKETKNIGEDTFYSVKSKPDDIESASRANIDDFENVYRNGLLNILEHSKLTTVGKVEALVNWSALWLAIMQYRRSCVAIGLKESAPIVCDCTVAATSVRRLARRQFQFAFSTIKKALDAQPEFSGLSAGQKNRICAFFPSTATAVGLINAYTGSRYYTLKVTALETIVAALVPHAEEIPFYEFVDKTIYHNLGLVVSRGAAKSSGLLEDFDGTIFEENEQGLAIQMKASGLLTTYSDATQMISFRR